MRVLGDHYVRRILVARGDREPPRVRKRHIRMEFSSVLRLGSAQ